MPGAACAQGSAARSATACRRDFDCGFVINFRGAFMNRFFKSAESNSSLPGGGIGPFRLPPQQKGNRQTKEPTNPPNTKNQLAEEALQAQRFDQAECLIEAVYALYD